MLPYTCTSGWAVPIVEIVSRCPLPLWMTWTNSDGSMSKFIVKLQHTLQARECWEGLLQKLLSCINDTVIE